MIIQKTKKIIFPITRYYFNFNKIKSNIFSTFSVVEILQSKKQLKLQWFKEEIFNTWIINLNESEEFIFKNFSATVRNEVNRAKKEWIIYEFIDNITDNYKNEYISFYNKFAEIKWLEKINKNYFYWLNSNLYLTKAIYNNSILVYHLYIFDKDIWIIRLLQSCSLFRDKKIEINKNLIWYANKWLHFFDILKFKELGFLEYDFWWLYLLKTDIWKLNIDKFKLSFWPKVETNYNYIKYWVFLKILLKILWKK